MKLFGQVVELTESMECSRGGDHRQLVHDARVDCLRIGKAPDERYVVCGRCIKAVSLRI